MVTNAGHEYQDMHTYIAWDFISQFRRAEDGTILIDSGQNADEPDAKEPDHDNTENSTTDKSENSGNRDDVINTDNKTEKNDDTSDPTKTTQIKTGDMHHTGNWIILITLCSSVILITVSRNKKKSY